MTATDLQTLDQFAGNATGVADDLIRRHAGWVYGVARRRVGDAELARDVTQATFLVLIQKMPRLRSGQPLSAWLFRVVNLAAAQALRDQSRRRRREMEAAKMRQQQLSAGSSNDEWNELVPLLDELVGRLRRADRHAVLLRFFERKSLEQVGVALGVSEDAARKRVTRATDKLREMFAARGVNFSAAGVLPALLLANVHNSEAPALSSIASTAAPTAQSSTLAKGVITMMKWMQVKSAAMVLIPILFVAGSGAAILTATTAAPSSAPASQVTTVALTLEDNWPTKNARYYVPRDITLSQTRPDTIKKLPPEINGGALYGVLPLVGTDRAVYHVIVDEPSGKPFRLFVDTNGDGDLTNDPPIEWASSQAIWFENGNDIKVTADDGTPCLTWQGSSTVDLRTHPGDAPYEVHFNMYRFDVRDRYRLQLTRKLFYYPDYATTGQMLLGDKKYAVALIDHSNSGDFRAPPDPSNMAAGVHLLIDRNRNGKFNERSDIDIEVHRPFKLDGVTYEISDIAQRGLSFHLVKSAKSLPDEVEVPGPEEMVGKPAITFTANTMDDKPINFPADFKGKLVLLDFWATWCGPCLGEAPNVVAAYDKFHSKGLEIVGVSLDKPDAEQTIQSVCEQKKMSWPQLYDGGFWKARIAVMYHVQSIPCAFLVDGDSGKVLAAGEELEGRALATSIEKALAAMRNK